MRRFVLISVLCVWAVMLALLVRRTLPRGAVTKAVAAKPGTPQVGEEWMGVYYETQKVGYSHHTFVPDGDGFAFSEESLLRLSVLETSEIVRTRINGHAGRDYALRDVTFELSSGVGTLQASGVVTAGELRLTLRTGKDVSEQRVPLREPIYLPSTLIASVGAEALHPQQEVDALVFDPTSLKNDHLHMTVDRFEPLPDGKNGEQAWRIREEFRGVKTTAWMDARGAVLREEGPMGFVLLRETADQAVNAGWASTATALDLVAKAAVPVSRPIADPRTRQRLRVRLSGIALDTVPSDDEQVRQGAVLSILRPRIEDVGTYRLPYDGEHGNHAADLAATAFLQSDHPRVRALARQIVGDDHDAKRAAGRLNDWVYEHLRKVPTVSIPNALQVLDMGEGDCNEHAVLLAALARAAGIPTRVVAGAVYLDGAFFYHAWCAVWLDRWVSIDPTFRQFPADATHLEFVVGDPEEQVAMMQIIGRLGVEVLPDRDGGAQ